MSESKESNPKDAIGCTKVPFSTIPARVIAEMGLGMLDGGCKYGRHNYRVAGVRSSIYYDACMRHLTDWWEGQDIDQDSGLHHITKLLTSACVLRDAQLEGMVTDDRPPPTKNPNWVREYNQKAKEIIARYPNPVQPFTRADVEPVFTAPVTFPISAPCGVCLGTGFANFGQCWSCHGFGQISIGGQK